MTARTPAPEQQVREQLDEMVHARAWYWQNGKPPRTTPSRYAQAAVDKMLERFAVLEESA